MKIKISEKIFEKFNGLHVGVIIISQADNNGNCQEILSDIKLQETEIKSKYNAESLCSLPKIDAWRKAYAGFGAKPKEHRSSVENLYRMILKGGEIRHINKLVDIYNYISLKHMLPVGGEDLDKIHGDIELTFAGENENEVILLGDKEAKKPHPGEVIYKDSISAICRRFNWREAERTKLTEETKNCIMVIEGLPPATREELENALVELAEMVKKYCNAEVKFAILDEKNTELEF
jgi:lysyl-tRNA synthetase class 2